MTGWMSITCFEATKSQLMWNRSTQFQYKSTPIVQKLTNFHLLSLTNNCLRHFKMRCWKTVKCTISWLLDRALMSRRRLSHVSTPFIIRVCFVILKSVYFVIPRVLTSLVLYTFVYFSKYTDSFKLVNGWIHLAILSIGRFNVTSPHYNGWASRNF